MTPPIYPDAVRCSFVCYSRTKYKGRAVYPASKKQCARKAMRMVHGKPYCTQHGHVIQDRPDWPGLDGWPGLETKG